ncbi:MAG TPA: alpha/beta hydrolase [Acidimicrobiales bacterium]|nr:alpha/beta hydrolase [Acidimicrobiales bacterium]
MGEFADGIVDSGGVEIAVRDYGGDGPPLVLVHGNGLSLASFDAMVPHLRDRFRLVSYDIRRQGLSGEGPFTWDTALADLEAVITHFGLDAPAIAGHSLGGMIAALYGGTDRPCRAAVNLDGHGLGIGIPADDPGEAATRARLKALSDEAVDSHFNPIPAAALDAQFASIPEDKREAVRASTMRQLVQQPDGSFRLRLTRESIDEVMDAVNGTDLFDVYRDCKCPLLIVNATKNDPSIAAQSPEMAELMPARRATLAENLRQLADSNHHIEVVEVDATHGLIAEIPEELSKIVAGFIARTPESAVD